VLGAGGLVGQAYESGVLAALEHDLGWDPRTAEIIVGTSAGSVTGTLLRLGVPASELAAWAVEAPLCVDRACLERWLTTSRPALPPVSVRHWLRPWRLPRPALLARIAQRPWAVRPSVAFMTLMPAGLTDLTLHTAVPAEVSQDPWAEGLWVCAARRDDGQRVVFGRQGAPSARLSDAVAASCAIPGYFAPVTVDGVEYIDGAVHSPTNADVLAGLGLDLVIVVSPMSAAGNAPRTADVLLRRSAHRRLRRERARLLADGTQVVRFEPGARTLAAMGVNMMADDRADAVVQAAFLETGPSAAAGRAAMRLRALRRAQGSRSATNHPARVPTYTPPSHTAGVDSMQPPMRRAQSSVGRDRVSETS
jgi:NTE family protein